MKKWSSMALAAMAAISLVQVVGGNAVDERTPQPAIAMEDPATVTGEERGRGPSRKLLSGWQDALKGILRQIDASYSPSASPSRSPSSPSSSPTKTPRWFVGGRGESCDDVCAKVCAAGATCFCPADGFWPASGMSAAAFGGTDAYAAGECTAADESSAQLFHPSRLMPVVVTSTRRRLYGGKLSEHACYMGFNPATATRMDCDGYGLTGTCSFFLLVLYPVSFYLSLARQNSDDDFDVVIFLGGQGRSRRTWASSRC